MGRIARIGSDSNTNYHFLATSNYDANNPAATTSAWPNDAAMDQAFNQPSPTEVTKEGVLILFNRFPDAFEGAQVKIHPTYDAAGGEDPFLEMWTHDSTDAQWTLRRSVELANLFVGVESGAHKVFDFTLFPFLEHIDKVWITMNPGSTGTPVMKFDAVRLFGQCETTLFHGGNISGGDPCADPTDPFYTGFDDNGNPCPGTSFGPPPNPPLPEVDLCNPASVAQYREVLATIPGALDDFNSWFDTNAAAIASFCAGSTPTPPPNMPVPPLTPLPALDLCDQTSIDAFRAAIAGDADQLAAFNDFIDTLTAAGFFDLNCPAPQPPSTPYNPHTLQPEADPPKTGPFGDGPGGSGPPGGDPRKDSVPPRAQTGNNEGHEVIAFFFNDSVLIGSDSQKTYFLNHLSTAPLEVQQAWAQHTFEIHGTNFGTAGSGINFAFTGAISGTIVGVRIIELTDANFQTTVGATVILSGDGTTANCVLNTQIGTFGFPNPTPGDSFFGINRTNSGATPNLRVSQVDSGTSVPPGSAGSRWLMAIVRAVPPAGVVTVLPTFYGGI